MSAERYAPGMPDSFRAGPIAPPATGRREPFRVLERLPIVLHVAFWIQIVGAAYSAINLGVMLIGFNRATFLAHARAVAEQKHERIVPDSFVIQGYVMEIVFFAIAIVLEVILALLIRRGLNWARILLTISLGLGFAALIVSPPTSPLAYATSAVNVALLVLIWLPPSNHYFRTVKVARNLRRSRQL